MEVVNASSYERSLDLRAARGVSLINLIEKFRKCELSDRNSIIDLACGAPKNFVSFWERLLVRSNSGLFKQAKTILGVDLAPCSNNALPTPFEYISADLTSLAPVSDRSKSFDIATCFYGFHWLVGGPDEHVKLHKAQVILNHADHLLTENGIMAIQHLFTSNNMPEVTLIALEALKATFPDFGTMTHAEYVRKRALHWTIPECTEDILRLTTDIAASSGSTFTTAIVMPSVSWHWFPAEDIWPLWSSVNSHIFMRGFTLAQQTDLERTFRSICVKPRLDELGISSTTHDGKLWAMLKMTVAQQIIHRSSSRSLSPAVMQNVKIGLHSKVRNRLREKLPAFEGNRIWFQREGVVNGTNSDNQIHNDVYYVAEPLLECIPKELGEVFSLNIRVGKVELGDSGAKMINVTPKPDHVHALEMDRSKLSRLLGTENMTLSEAVFSNQDHPDDFVLFVGKDWGNYFEWYDLASDQPSETLGLTSALWLESVSTPPVLGPLPPIVLSSVGNSAVSIRDKPISVFLRFVLEQFSGKRFALLVSTTRSYDVASLSLDAASLTVIATARTSTDRNLLTAEFPTVRDCDALWSSLNLFTTLSNRQSASRRRALDIFRAESHERNQLLEFAFDKLLGTRFRDILTRVKIELIGDDCEARKQDIELVENGLLILFPEAVTAIQWLAFTWSSSKERKDDFLFAENHSINFKHFLVKLVECAAKVAAVADVKNLAISSFDDVRYVRHEWTQRLSIRASQVQIACHGGVDRIVVPKLAKVASESSLNQTWLVRAVVASLTNAMKHAPSGVIHLNAILCGGSLVIEVKNSSSEGHPDKEYGTESVLQLCASSISPPGTAYFGPGKQSQNGTDLDHWTASLELPLVLKQPNPWLIFEGDTSR
ncbi:hypothetical protein VN12_24650 [Pirellula sp. SH-Sr6A]|uniref:hypothetical protein n=1 Tax=Pirellula sp. SH-Sr6A TaxID=1632865 RepID=UPI00078E4860|nr:hypothetical protein [Pirellula sp. SH-Sr6A]AMV35339.1 hypothetical protein VN12_24650 [Pirellula sp. SH-Sr6A]